MSKIAKNIHDTLNPSSQYNPHNLGNSLPARGTVNLGPSFFGVAVNTAV
jgi:hypothetical protein